MFLNSLIISNFVTEFNNFTWLAESFWSEDEYLYFTKNLNLFPSYLTRSIFIRNYKPHPKRKQKFIPSNNLFGVWILKHKSTKNPCGILIVEGRSKLYKSVNLYFQIDPQSKLTQDELTDSLIPKPQEAEALSYMISSLFICFSFDLINLVDLSNKYSEYIELSSYEIENLYSTDDQSSIKKSNDIKKIVILPEIWKEDHQDIYDQLEYLKSRKIKL